MATLADFQSILQLGAGLAIGFSGILSLFRDPVEAEKNGASFLGKRTRSLSRRYANLNEDQLKKVDRLSDSVDALLDKIQSSNEGKDFFALKVIALIASLLCVAGLIYSSEVSDGPLDNVTRVIAYLSLAYVPLAIAWVWFEFQRIRKKFGTERKSLEAQYNSCVDEILATR